MQIRPRLLLVVLAVCLVCMVALVLGLVFGLSHDSPSSAAAPPVTDAASPLEGKYELCIERANIKAQVNFCRSGLAQRVFSTYQTGCSGPLEYTHYSYRQISAGGNTSAGGVIPVDIKAVSDVYIAASINGQATLKAKCPGLNFTIGSHVEVPARCGKLVLGHVPECRTWYADAQLASDSPARTLVGTDLHFSTATDCFTPTSNYTKGCHANKRCTIATGAHWGTGFPRVGDSNESNCQGTVIDYS